jgi:hypothetical protein
MPESYPSDILEGFSITEKGRYDLLTADRCVCNPKLTGVIVECPECHTVYGHLTEILKAQERGKPQFRRKLYSVRHR